MPFVRTLLAALLSLSAVIPLRAHAPGESSLVIARDEEALEVRLVVTLASANALLGPARSTPLAADTFDQDRPALLAAAAQGLFLRDPEGVAISPDRIIATVRDGHEVHIDFFFPPASRPARLGLPLLAKLDREAWCDVADLRVSPPARALLRPRATELPLVP